MMNDGDLYELGKDPGPLDYQDDGAYASLARQHIARINREIWKLFERGTPKVKFKATDVRALYAREFLHVFG
jgi:hypothetical protein